MIKKSDIDSLGKKLLSLKDKIPQGSIEIDKGTTVLDSKLFVNSHWNILNGNIDDKKILKKTFEPYYDRLLMFSEVVEIV